MNTSKKQRKFSPEFKLNVVLESYASGNARATADRHSIHITQLNNWRKKLLTDGVKAFLPKRQGMSVDQKKLEEYEKVIGRLTIQNELLKKTQELLA